jgi:uncharacterized RDD family membrane protein YckC
MSCPHCGDVCRCTPSGEAALRQRNRFEPESSTTSTWADPEVDDNSEQRFSESLEKPALTSRFIVQASQECLETRGTENRPPSDPAPNRIQFAGPDAEESVSPAASPSFHLSSPRESEVANEDAWRTEVAARVHRYRSRRPRGPRYPSLELNFDSPSVHEAGDWHTPPTIAMDRNGAARVFQVEAAAAETARIIPFPRSAIAPPPRLDELADPVPERPRILEVPEVAPPPPALGGILIQGEEQPRDERRPGIDIPLQAAPLGRRMVAGGVDGGLVLGAAVGCGYVFFRITAFLPTTIQMTVLLAGCTALFWSAYQYLLLVYSGTTPGLWIARLRLTRFDGGTVRRGLRRWRVLASLLSGLSVGLGYAWCFLDEDALCWHDRITRTFLAPIK